MPRYIVQQDGKISVNGKPLAKGDLIELPAGLAEEYGAALVLPETANYTEPPLIGGSTRTPKPKRGGEP